jgi:tetratricopeptide (TPR) repeat protein/DNA-binding CsgD family transcriptional regulator
MTGSDQQVAWRLRMDSYTDRIDSLLAEANELYTSDLERCIALVREAIQLSRHHDDTRRLARALLMQGKYHRTKLEIDSAKKDIASVQALIATLPQQETESLRLDAIRDLGSICFAEGNYREAAAHFAAALRLAQERNVPEVVDLHHDLGAALMQLGEMDTAVEHMIHAIRASEAKDGSVYMLGLFNLATVCYNTNDLVSARAYLEEALACNNSRLWLEAMCTSRLADVLGKEKEYDLALPLAEKAVGMARAHGGAEFIREAIFTRSELLLESGELPAAIEGFEEAGRIAEAPADKASALTSLALIHARIAFEGTADAEQVLLPESASRAREYIAEFERITDPIDDINMNGILRNISEVHAILGDHARAYDALKKSQEIKNQLYSPKVRNDIGSLRHLLRIEREEHEKEIQKMKAEQMEKELGNATLQLLAQTELLSDLRSDLLKIARKIPPTEPGARELRERVKNLPCQSVDWERFDRQFRSVHPEFIRRLTERAPDMTTTEVRICTMLRMNLKSHEMAKVFCITEGGVEFHRRNIRRKLKLTKEEKLPIVLGAM